MSVVRIILVLVVLGATLFVSIFMFYGQRALTAQAYFIIAPLVSALLVVLTILSILGIKVEKRGCSRIIISVLCIGIICFWISLISIKLGLTILIGALAIVGLIRIYEVGRHMVLLLGALASIIVIVGILILGYSPALHPPYTPLELVEYKAVFNQYESDSKEFLLTETWVVRQISSEESQEPITIENIRFTGNVQRFTRGQLEPLSFPLTIIPFEEYVFVVAKSVQSTRDGFLVRKCEFEPSQLIYEWFPSNQTEKHELLSSVAYDCYAEKTRVEVNLPKGSFCSANTQYSIVHYGSMDIAGWDLPDDVFLGKRIGFVFVDPPFHQWKWLFEPFIGISSFGEAIPIALKISAPICGGIVLIFFRRTVIKRLKHCFQRKGGKEKHDLTVEDYREENDNES